MSVSYVRTLASRMTVAEVPNPNHMVRNIHGQTDLSYSEHTLAENKSDVPKSDRTNEIPQILADQNRSHTTGSDTNTTNLNDNLQRLRKRIKKLSRRVVEAEKNSLIKLYENPTQDPQTVDINAPAHLRVGYDGDQKKTSVEKDNSSSKGDQDVPKVKGKKRRKRKKIVEKTSSSTTVHSDESSNECTRIRKTDILQMIQQKEQLIHAGDESDVDTDCSPTNSSKNKDGVIAPEHTKFDAVSNTITKLNNVNDHVQQVITQSLSRKSSIVSIISSVKSSKRSIKPVNKILTASSTHFVPRVRSMADTTPTATVHDVKIPVTIPEYLKRVKTAPAQLTPNSAPSPKKKAKRSPKDSDTNQSKEKSDESPVIVSKSVLKKSTTRKKPKKDRVVFNEPPEIIFPQNKTIILKSESELLKELKPKKKRSKRRDTPPSRPVSRGDSLEGEKKKPKIKSKNKPKQSEHEIIVDTPQTKVSLIEEQSAKIVSAETTEEHQEQPAVPDSKEICRKMRKNTTHTLSNLNVQMSNTLKESIAHLNDICMRVRTTLSDMEKEQVKYNRKRRCPELSSETGSMMEMDADMSVISMRTDNTTATAVAVEGRTKSSYQISDVVSEPSTIPREYTVVKKLENEGAIDQILTSISMCGDDFPTTTTLSDKERRRQKKKIKKAKKQKEQEAREAQKETPPPVDPRQELCERPQCYRIPIWERKPPSVINDIQMIVRKQATRSQYKEFMKTLKRETRKIRPSTIILPQESKVCLDPSWPGQAKVKPATKYYKFAAYQKIKEIRESLAENSRVKGKKCSQCASDKCTCGITVENVHPATSAQKMQWIKTRSAMARRGIQAYDILDEITLKDLEPLQSEYPRKDHITNEDSVSKVEETLLYRLLYNESPEVLETLLRSASGESTIKKVSSPQKTDVTPSPSTVAKREEVMRPLNLVSKAYQMYEKLELGSEPPATPPGTPRTKIVPIKIVSERLKSPDAKTKRPLHTCPKQFNDTPNIPTDLYNNMNEDTKRKALRKPSSKFCNVKLRTDPEINLLKKRKKDDKKKLSKNLAPSTSSITTAKKHAKQKKREYMKPRIKPYLIDPNMNLKNILTVMRVSIHPKSFPTLDGIISRDKRFPITRTPVITPSVPNLSISEENRAKIAAMSKRDVVRILKPYIFMDIKPPVILVMPVQTKYTCQSQQPTHYPVHSASRVRTTEAHNRRASDKTSPSKKSLYCKDHGDNSLSPLRKYCKRCLQIQHDATDKTNVKKNHVEVSSTSKRTNTSSQRVRPMSPKLSSRKSPSKMLSEEITNNAILTRNKLNEVKTLVNNNKAYFPKDLNKAIEDIEFKIVDVLSNPSRHYPEAFVEIEDEIKAILSTMGGTAGKIADVNKRVPLKTKPKPLKAPTSTNLDETPGSPLRCLSHISINENKIVVPELRFDTCEESGDAIQRAVAEKPLEDDDDVLKQEPPTKDDSNFATNFSADIEQAIQGLDAIMSMETSDVSDDKQSTVCNTDVSLISDNRSPKINSDCKNFVSNVCEQVERVVQKFTRTEDTQTDVSQETASDDQKDIDELTHRSDDYLTPYMRAVKTYRNTGTSQSFVDFLDILSNLPTSDKPITAEASSETTPIPMCDTPVSIRGGISQENCMYDENEFATMVDECLMCEGLMDRPTESYHQEEFGTMTECEIKLSNSPSSYIPVEIMNSPRSMYSSREIFDTTMSTVCQTIPTEDEFNEVEDYVNQFHREMEQQMYQHVLIDDSLHTIDRIEEEPPAALFIEEETTRDMGTVVSPDAITPRTHNETQIPCDPMHECFTSTATTDTQVTEELKDMSTDTKEVQAHNLTFNLFSASITSAEEIATTPKSESVSVSTQDDQESISRAEKSTSIDSADCVMASGCSITPRKPIVINETRTDTCLHTTHDKPGSGLSKSIMSLDLISIYESKKANDEKGGDVPDLMMATGGQVGSHQLMSAITQLIECEVASRSNSSSPRSDDAKEKKVDEEIKTMADKGVGDYSRVSLKLAPVIYHDYTKLLNSFYGLLFTIMFLSLNLTYTCC